MCVRAEAFSHANLGSDFGSPSSCLVSFVCCSAQRIHTSSETYLALIRDDAYELQLRGEIEVKVNLPPFVWIMLAV